MSNSGPAPRRNRNSGSWCQRCGPGSCIRASALCGSPMTPSSISRRAVCSPAPSTVSGAQPTRTPARTAAASRARPAVVSRARGFSFQTCWPAATACPATSACAAGMVRLTTSSTSGCAMAWAALPTPGTPYLAACALARSRSRLAQNSTRRSGKEVRLPRYSSLIVPQPMTATPTGSVVTGLAACGGTHRLGQAPAGPPGQAVPDRGHHVGRAPVELDHAPRPRRGGGQDLRDRHPPGTDRGHRVVPGHGAVLDVQVADPLAGPAGEGGEGLAADRGPVGVQLEQHRRVKLGGQGLQRGGAVREAGPAGQRGELVIVVVVAEAQAPGGRPAG